MRQINLTAGADVGSAASSAGIVVNARARGGIANVYGTFVGTYKLEVSNDGTNYVPATDSAAAAVSGKTVPAAYALSGPFAYIRLTCTAYTSGTISWNMYVDQDAMAVGQ